MKKWFLMAGAMLPALALATAITNGGGSAGTASASDVTLGGIAANQLVYSAGVNPQQGKNGNSSGFSGAYAGSGSGSWSSIGKFSGTSTKASTTLNGLKLTMGFSLADTRHGTWSITNANTLNNLSLDLVFAMHTGGGSGAWLFDNYLLNGASTANGSWSLNLLNNGGQLADYSNLTLFVRNAAATAIVAPPPPVVPVPVVPVIPSLPSAAGGAGNSVADITPVIPPAAVPQDDTLTFDIPLSELLAELAARNEQLNAGTPVYGSGSGGGQQAGGGAAAVPEPGSVALFGLAGLIGATVWRRKRPALAQRA